MEIYMKERRIKSIYYKLISMGCDIFTDDNKNELQKINIAGRRARSRAEWSKLPTPHMGLRVSSVSQGKIAGPSSGQGPGPENGKIK